MAENSQTSCISSDRPWPVIKKGVLLGMLASVVGTTTVVAVMAGIFLVRAGLSYFVSGLWYIPALAGGVTLALTIPPASVGGGANALALYVVGRRRELTIPIGVLVGALSGLFWGLAAVALGGWVTSGYSWHLYDPGEMVRETLAILPIGECIGASVGAWHGWRMARYLRGRPSATSSTELTDAE
jgi:hypothetical protein